MDFVCGISIPDDELSVLGGRDEMSSVSRPVHGVDLGKMAFERSLRLHGEPWESFETLSRDVADCGQDVLAAAPETPLDVAALTRCVCELILLALYAVLQSLGIPASDLDLLLDGLSAHVGGHVRLEQLAAARLRRAR